MKRTKRVYRTKSDWELLIQQQSESGLPVRAFCKQQGIGDQSFYLWRKRLAIITEAPETPAVNLIDISSMVATSSLTQWHIELDLGDGIKLNLRQA